MYSCVGPIGCEWLTNREVILSCLLIQMMQMGIYVSWLQNKIFCKWVSLSFLTGDWLLDCLRWFKSLTLRWINAWDFSFFCAVHWINTINAQLFSCEAQGNKQKTSLCLFAVDLNCSWVPWSLALYLAEFRIVLLDWLWSRALQCSALILWDCFQVRAQLIDRFHF